MADDIKQWADIKDRFVHGLILGNGASIAVHRGFDYKGLFAEAQRLGHLNGDALEVFRQFGVEDFELVLRHLWHFKVVSDALKLTGEPVARGEAAYVAVRTALIETVRHTHVSYPEALPHLEHIHKFLRQFRTVLSLNYDLLLYWAAQYGNEALHSPYNFKDCFDGDRQFAENWEEKRGQYRGVENPTLYFYPHGNLVLSRDRDDTERKIVAGQYVQLLDVILSRWESGSCVPLFVCEGVSKRKKLAIDGSVYLGRVYREVIPSIGESLVIYGWSLAEQEDHIIGQIQRHLPRRVAVSIRKGNKTLMRRAEELFGGQKCELVFFDSDSPGAWNHPVV